MRDENDLMVAVPITGYRKLTVCEVDMVNRIEAMAESVGKLVQEVDALVAADPRWVAIGRTELQQGFMALTRAVTRPTTF